MRRVLERLLNLLAFLRTTSRPVTAEEIRFTVAGYDTENDQAFRRMFERDKDLLRSMGVPLATVEDDDGAAYVLPSSDYEMPDPGLTEEERAALWLAHRIASLGGSALGEETLYKLGGAAGGSVPGVGLDLGGERAALGLAFQAITERRRLSFVHRGRRRIVEPYGMLHQRGHWYLVAGTEEGERAFRTDRCAEWAVEGDADAFSRPEGLDLRSAVPLHPWEAGEGTDRATVRFDAAERWWVERQLPGTVLRPVEGGFEVDLDAANPDALISWVLEFGPAAELVGPEALRAQLVERVRSA
jgi:proteasome accessory factor B